MTVLLLIIIIELINFAGYIAVRKQFFLCMDYGTVSLLNCIIVTICNIVVVVVTRQTHL